MIFNNTVHPFKIGADGNIAVYLYFNRHWFLLFRLFRNLWNFHRCFLFFARVFRISARETDECKNEDKEVFHKVRLKWMDKRDILF